MKQLSALSMGIEDFLMKPVLPHHLINVVKSRAKRAVTVSHYITRDSLTNLFNHTSILQHLYFEILRARRQHYPLICIMLDIDFFKKINDKYGHIAGDGVLRALSALLVSRCRKTDFIGRYGGEEFLIFLPNASLENGIRLINEIREIFAKIDHRGEHETFKVTFSAGVSSYPELFSANDMIEAADVALYKAKRKGRNCVVGYEANKIQIQKKIVSKG